MAIRNSAKAIIVKDGKVLLTTNEDAEGSYYLFPGGGQELGETLPEAAVRECMEEIGCSVEVKSLIHIREYIGERHEHAETDSGIHQIEYYFECQLQDDLQLAVPSNPDTQQTGFEWVEIEDLLAYRIYPRGIRCFIQEFESGGRNSVYLGAFN
ncbi:NUDIX domain-containing protein [Planococcus dechangensis]|uniref:NUDIX domain-containing protein n=1 Tax=Planococcus dechangensis TaxID=1176255 RepID=A0ABV9MFD1_9BACL